MLPSTSAEGGVNMADMQALKWVAAYSLMKPRNSLIHDATSSPNFGKFPMQSVMITGHSRRGPGYMSSTSVSL